MKRFISLLALAILISGTLSQAQEKATLSTYRVFPKPGKDSALRKAIADHVAKYHTGNWSWRVFSVLSGTDEGSYQLNEGPNSWTALEERKEISDEHQRDYENTILPLVERSTSTSYMILRKNYSTDSVGGAFKKALLRSFYPKPGRSVRVASSLATWKKVWEKLGVKVTVWTSFYSGEPRWVIASRLGKGWVDLEKPMGKASADAFDEIAGAGAHARYLEDLADNVDRIDEEMIELLPELSSK